MCRLTLILYASFSFKRNFNKVSVVIPSPQAIIRYQNYPNSSPIDKDTAMRTVGTIVFKMCTTFLYVPSHRPYTCGSIP